MMDLMFINTYLHVSTIQKFTLDMLPLTTATITFRSNINIDTTIL
jgi:hypothetical protein